MNLEKKTLKICKEISKEIGFKVGAKQIELIGNRKEFIGFKKEEKKLNEKEPIFKILLGTLVYYNKEYINQIKNVAEKNNLEIYFGEKPKDETYLF
jgi:hypothetical protein